MGFERLRHHISAKLTERERANTDTDLAGELRAAVASSVNNVHFWWRIDERVLTVTHAKLGAYIDILNGKEAQLAAIASRQDRIEFAKQRVEVEKVVRELFDIAQATGSPSIRKDLIFVNARMAELSTLENSWQALPGSTNVMAQRIGRIIRSTKLALDVQGDLVTVDLLHPDDTPGTAMSKLTAYCSDKIMRLVVESHETASESSLRAALGTRYQDYLARADLLAEMRRQQADAEKSGAAKRIQQELERQREKDAVKEHMRQLDRLEHPRI